jgi:uncharacterized membrane protein YdjX (TVP38/TMEM64 family)
MLAGVTWTLPKAIAIVCGEPARCLSPQYSLIDVVGPVGVLLGEIANFFAFKYFCSARGAKMEKSKLSYALLAHVVCQGGFLVVVIIRYSAIPAHCAFLFYFTCIPLSTRAAVATVIFSTVGISFPVFIAAAILSLPKAAVPVYIGYAMKDNSMSL